MDQTIWTPDGMRIVPLGSPQAYQTHRVKCPRETHTRRATCQDVDCDYYANGWLTVVDEGTELGQFQAAYIRQSCGRHYREQRIPEGSPAFYAYPPGTDELHLYPGGITEFHFYPEQQCFTEHRVTLERPEIFLLYDGDWRQSEFRMRFDRADQWQEHLGEHLERINDAQNRG